MAWERQGELLSLGLDLGKAGVSWNPLCLTFIQSSFLFLFFTRQRSRKAEDGSCCPGLGTRGGGGGRILYNIANSVFVIAF